MAVPYFDCTTTAVNTNRLMFLPLPVYLEDTVSKNTVYISRREPPTVQRLFYLLINLCITAIVSYISRAIRTRTNDIDGLIKGKTTVSNCMANGRCASTVYY